MRFMFSFCIGIILGFLVMKVILSSSNHKVQVGEVWVYEYNKNPFKPIRRDTMTVLSIKGDFIQYRSKKYGINSDRYRWFLIGAHKIK